MISPYDTSITYAKGNLFMIGNTVCKAVRPIEIGDELVLFSPKTRKGNYIEIYEVFQNN